ncbi:hypothetical protein [Kribbella sp.]|uniref:hypothetical protein n=1 Tax=Kribbella sp. TaxID=1871183 RepID=UPI002D6BF9A1|nr:hypothetical protein [Kribbella sp.]HZX04973.1 hypothetical protein [Kribbella sp.]
MRIPFTTRGHDGEISVRVEPNDPAVSGHYLVAPGLDPAGFPVCTASLTFGGVGIDAILGWIQVVSSAGEVSVDLMPNLDGTDPFYTYGYLPTFFDAPANPDHSDGVWRADTFLVAVPDVIRSRRVVPVAGFTWGYELVGGRPVVLGVEELAVGEWAGHRELLGSRHPAWGFV